MNKLNLQDGEYYRINNTKKILYWDGEKWMKPMKDQQKKYGSWLTSIDTQPNVKSVELIPHNQLNEAIYVNRRRNKQDA